MTMTTEILDESELAVRLKTSVASVRWMRRTGRISFIKIAGNRKVRFRWPQVLDDLRAAEVRASVHDAISPALENGQPVPVGSGHLVLPLILELRNAETLLSR